MNFFIHKYKQFKGIVFFLYLDTKRFFRILLKKPIFYVIGDSHTLCFQHEAFKIIHIGPATAYKLNFKKSTTDSREKVISILDKIYKNKSLSIIFVLGELDVRIHINKALNVNKKTLTKTIEETVIFYTNFLKFIKHRHPLLNIYIFNVLPQGEQGNIYNYPSYATRKKRIIIAEKMNKILRAYARKYNFKFIYIYNKLIDKKGDRKKEYVYDDVHFNRKIMPLVIDSISKKYLT